MTAILSAGLFLMGQASSTPPPAASGPGDSSATAAAVAAEKAAEAARAAADAATLAARAAAEAAGLKPNPDAGAPVPAPAPVVSGAAAASSPSTSGLVDLNVIWLTGNSNALTFSANGQVSHTFRGGWILSGKANGMYGQTEAAGTTVTQVNALAAGGSVRGDKVTSPESSVYLLGGADTD